MTDETKDTKKIKKVGTYLDREVDNGKVDSSRSLRKFQYKIIKFLKIIIKKINY